MLLNVLSIGSKVASLVGAGGISSLLSNVVNIAGLAKSQFEKLRNSPLDALRGINKLGVNVEFVSDERYDSNGELQRRFSVGLVGDNVENFQSLFKNPTVEGAADFYRSTLGGANLNRTITAVTTDGAKSAVSMVITRDPDQNYTTKVFTDKLVDFSERLYDGVSDGSTKIGLLNQAAAEIAKAEEVIEDTISKGESLTNSILGDATSTENLSDKIELDPKSDVFGLSSIETVDMKNLSSKTILKTYEEMEAAIRSSTREITEVVVHHTDTFEDQPVDYDDVYKWHSARNFSDVGYHFLILRSGDLQVARPISKKGAHCLKGHNNYSIGIAFVGGRVGSSKNGGSKRSSTTFRPEQWNTFKAFMRAFYSVHPGGQAWGHNDIDPERRSDPNFDVVAYVENSFGKENVQTPEQARSTGGLSIDEIIERQ